MKRQMMLTGAIVLAAASAISFSTAADAKVVRHHFVHHAAAHRDGKHRHAVHREYLHTGVWVGGGWTGDNWVGGDGWMNSYYNGYGSYHGYVGDFCGTIAWTLDLCGPHGP